MTAWHETSPTSSASASLPELLDGVLAAALQVQHADSGSIHLYDAEPGTLKVLVHRGFDESYLQHFAQRGTTSLCRAAVDGRQRVIVEDVTADPRCEWLRPFAAAARLRAMQCTPLMSRKGEMLGVLSTIFRRPYRPEQRELTLTDLLARQAGDIIACRAAEDTLRRSHHTLQQALDAAEIGIWTWDPLRDIAIADPRALQLLGAQLGTTFSFRDTPGRYLHPDDVEGWRHAIEAAVDPTGTGVLHTEYRWRRPDGQQIWLQGCGRTDFEGEGSERRAVRLSGTIIDITERKSAEERQVLMTREIDHRARNLLASVQAMISLSTSARSDLGEFARTMNSRLVSLVRAHTLTEEVRYGGASLRQVLADELIPFVHGRPEVASLEGPDLRLEAGAVTAFSMIVHELVTNAAKYGSLSVHGGRVSIRWRENGDDAVQLEWKESGGPPVAPPRRRGFGSQLLLRAVELQVGGSARVEFEPDGVRCQMTFPIARRGAAARVPGTTQ